MPGKKSATKKLTPRQRRDLDIKIAFMEGIVRRDPDYVEAWEILGDDYTSRGKYAEGLKVDLRLALLRPDDPMVHYNLGCSYALNRKFTKSMATLEQAVRLGFHNLRQLARDPDLSGLRKHPSYPTFRTKLGRIKAASAECR